MATAAIPNYLRGQLQEAWQEIPPGHRFGLYASVWQPSWKKVSDETARSLDKVCKLGKGNRELLTGLRARQQALADQRGEHLLQISAIATSPLTTGLGIEHPTENGFAFLSPYGLPYLAGSGVKGVLRRAAEELALGLYGDPKGWTLPAVWWLFGFEGGSTYLAGAPHASDPYLREEAERQRAAYLHAVEALDANDESLVSFLKLIDADARYQHDSLRFLRDLVDDRKLRDKPRNQGALRCWDVLPDLERLEVDVLTAHHRKYYEGDHAPHDSENPVPVYFLTLPPGSQFDFHIACDAQRLPDGLRESWPALMSAALEHAFDWLGFGAKTSVGYGQMARNRNREVERAEQRQAAAEQAREAQRQAELSPVEREIEALLENVQLQEQDSHLLRELEAGRWEGENASLVAKRIKALMEQNGKWRPDFSGSNKKKKQQRDISLRVQQHIQRDS